MKRIEKLDVKKAFEYYRKGLNSKEISKLMGCSFRTVQNYMSANHWKEKRAEFEKNSR